MCADPKKYYEAYEDRYRRVYAQGVKYWTGDPDEIATVTGHLDEFLQFAGTTPASDSIIEFGCGEGFLGEHLLRKGYSYLGIDLSPSALHRARSRLPGNDSSFMIGDITNMRDMQIGSFDVALDNYCLHMLVTDEDRRKYLAEIHRVLKSDGHAWFHEIGQPNPFKDEIQSLEDFLARYPVDLATCEARDAYTQGEKTTVYLPRIPARFNNCDGYREELEGAGFEIQLLETRRSGIVVFARTEKRSAEQWAGADGEDAAAQP